SQHTHTQAFAQCSAGMLLATAGRRIAYPVLKWRGRRASAYGGITGPLYGCVWDASFSFGWMPAGAAARCPPCVRVLPALGVILLSPMYLLCRVRVLLFVC
ncbi:hypothetical protein TcCL_NonESM09253, partial [Trypanosoma cruzi]